MAVASCDSRARSLRIVDNLTREQERQLAVDLFNLTWTLLEQSERTPEEDDLMAHAAHASAYHWRRVGEPVNFLRSEWQCSRVYAVLGRREAALHHARRCLALCQGADLADFDRPYALEALARAHALAGDVEEAGRYAREAGHAADTIADAEDRDHFLEDLATLPSAVGRDSGVSSPDA